MARDGFGDIRVFVEVARRGGFRAAAEHLQLAPASVSEAVQRFEDRLGVRLLERSSRSVALTPIGEQFYAKSLPAIIELEGAMNDLDEQKDEVTGTLRLTAPYSAGPFFLDDLVARFALEYPGVNVELIYDDKKVDLLASGVDAAIRSNTLLGPDTHAVPVGPELAMTIVASPQYLDENGRPEEPKDILNHDAICYAFGMGGQNAPWGFDGPDGAYTMQPKPRMVANDMRSLVHYAKQGLGLAYLYREIAVPHLGEDGLTEVLSDHLVQLPRYSLNYRSKRNMTRRLRAFVDMAKASPAGR
ncbi:LysR family transcriptional regulator [Marinovum sp. 2_MG-2023]|uniref:LysR family transcriptional regulator n=1 Tax=unclassified Marinovum TaxID=2647166 RepID=UPI0026E27DEF|nr:MULTISPECIES: LysR family transcriptional regulator [unclassified Marinovum]MDO6731869.1 LysR family transcriptional regulator [Marinovum sp. 2_MG-2023]MDO6781121.1 LysR family transcriptional regulator [Marinovum sp. 1_MG-2023]